jgi:hypothetical protein
MLLGITTADTVSTDPEHRDDVSKLLSNAAADRDIMWQFSEDHLTVSGPNWFDVYPTDDDGSILHTTPITEAVLVELQQYLAEDAEWVIKTVYFDTAAETLRGRAYKLQPNHALTCNLDGSWETLDEDRDRLVELGVVQRETADTTA